MGTLRKKVSFEKKPVFLGSAGRKDIHSGILQHYRKLIVKHLSLTSPVYRRLKENGILTTDQIGLLELEDSPEQKISKLIDVLKRADHHVFTTFCAILHETDHHHLAQILQKAIINKTHELPEVMPVPQNKQLVNEAILLHQEYDRTIKQENEQLRKKIKRMKNKYMSNLKELEEKITIAKWESDLAIRERNILCNENEALQNLNTELQALVRRLQETIFESDLKDHRTLRPKVMDLGFSLDYLQEKSRKFYTHTHLGLVYR
ncbi:uncharacterized protein LOC120928796 [Rana temporaria]|uniref:uncharacterized protein LOC120928796 n=1 Tax=Rana temporaria TaxID=8407 RepID=UPI001AADA325|nr:uncharacterized protein LOC120928796 [Rana temporaria]